MPPRLPLDLQPFDQHGRAHIVGQVCHHAVGLGMNAEKLFFILNKRITNFIAQLVGVIGADHVQNRFAAHVHFNGEDMLGTFHQQCAGEATRARANFKRCAF